jgi:hypothetical protein
LEEGDIYGRIILKWNLQKIGNEAVNWITVAQDRVKLQALWTW